MLRELWRQKRVQRLEGQRMPDHIHRGRCTPPTESVAHTSGFLKGKSAVRIWRESRWHERRWVRRQRGQRRVTDVCRSVLS